MSLNLTLFGQMITFALFVWFTMKFVWPPLTKVMQDRQKQIADGLAAAQQGQKELELAEHKRTEILTEAKAKSAAIVEQANHRANHIIEEAKAQARKEGERLIEIAQAEVQQQYNEAKQELLGRVSRVALLAAERILNREIDANKNSDIVEELVREM